MRAALWIAYGVVLLVIVWTATHPGKSKIGEVVAAADLPANRLIRQGDLRLDGQRLYLSRKVRKGERVGGSDIADWPRSDAPPGRLLVALPYSPASLSGPIVNAGGKVTLCPVPEGGPASLPVVSVLCSSDEKSCLVVAAASAAEAAKLTTGSAGQFPIRACR